MALPTLRAVAQGKLGIAAEHGFYIRRPGEEDWDAIKEDADSAWRDMVLPIMKVYADSTDGSYTEEKESALVWNYSNADPDFGHWQVQPPLPLLALRFLNRASSCASHRSAPSLARLLAAPPGNVAERTNTVQGGRSSCDAR